MRKARIKAKSDELVYDNVNHLYCSQSFIGFKSFGRRYILKCLEQQFYGFNASDPIAKLEDSVLLNTFYVFENEPEIIDWMRGK